MGEENKNIFENKTLNQIEMENNINSFHQTNDLIKVSEKKNNPVVVALLLIALVILILIFIIFELPMIKNM